MKFSERVSTSGNVEHWLGDVEKMMKKTMYDQMKGCVQDYTEDNRGTWLFQWPAQCILTVDQIIWVRSAREAENNVYNRFIID